MVMTSAELKKIEIKNYLMFKVYLMRNCHSTFINKNIEFQQEILPIGLVLSGTAKGIHGRSGNVVAGSVS